MHWVTQILALDIGESERLILLRWWSLADEPLGKRTIVRIESGHHPDGTVMFDAQRIADDLRCTVLHGRSTRSIRGHIASLRAAGLAHVSGLTVDLVPPSEAVPIAQVARPKPAKRKTPGAASNPKRRAQAAKVTAPGGSGCGELFGDPATEQPPLTVEALVDRPIAEQIAGIFDEWDRLRVAAGRAHGKRPRPAERSVKRKREIKRSIGEHGYDAVLAGLRYVGAEWARDRSSFEAFSTTPFTENAIARAVGLARRTPPQGKQWSRDPNYGAMGRHGRIDDLDAYTEAAMADAQVDDAADGF